MKYYIEDQYYKGIKIKLIPSKDYDKKKLKDFY